MIASRSTLEVIKSAAILYFEPLTVIYRAVKRWYRKEPAEPSSEESPACLDPAVDVVARTIWGEARGEGKAGMEAVAAVIANRVKLGARSDTDRYGKTFEEVCRKPFQFSTWNESDPNRTRALAVTSADQSFAIALQIARQTVAGELIDVTGGATHYVRVGTLPRPEWSHKTRIGERDFYREAA